LKQPISGFFYYLESDQGHYGYDFKSENQLLKDVKDGDKELLPLIRSFKRIENSQIKKYLLSLIVSISKPQNKKIKL